MFRKTLLLAISFTIATASTVRAQNDAENAPITGEPEVVTLIKERIALIKAFYPISDSQLAALEKDLNSRIDSHQEYMNRNQLMIRRRTTAISAVLPQDQTHSVEQINALRDMYQEEIYRIREAAPLSLTAAVRTAEDMLTPDGRTAGRQKMEAFFAKQLNGKHIDPSHLDRLVLTQVPMLDVSQHDQIADTQDKLMGTRPSKVNASKRPTPEEIKTAKAAAIKAKNEANKARAADPHAGHNHGPIPPAASDRKVEVITLKAPSIDQWEVTYQTWATDYDFTPEQKAAAQAIFEHCASQARNQKGTDDVAAKSLDRIFTQMKQRIDSVASIEQRERLKSKEEANAKSESGADKSES